EVAADQGFLLRSRPTVDLALCRDRVRDAFKPLRENESDGASRRRVTAVMTGVVLRDALLETLSRCSRIVAPVGALMDVNIRPVKHRRDSCRLIFLAFGHPSKRTLLTERAPQDEGCGCCSAAAESDLVLRSARKRASRRTATSLRRPQALQADVTPLCCPPPR